MSGTISPALTVARKDLRQRFRDRSAVVLGFAAPLAIAIVMSVAFHASEHFHADVAVVNYDHGALGTAFVAMLDSPDISRVVGVKPVSGEPQARKLVKNGALGAAFVIPAGFTEAALGNSPTRITVLSSVNRSIAGQIGSSLAQSFTTQLQADRLAVATAVSTGGDPSALGELAAQSATLRLPLAVTSGDLGRHQLTATSYYAPSMGIFFVFFGIGFGARSFWAERRSGTLDRIVASPAPLGATIAGKALSSFAFAAASLTTMAVVTTSAFGADWGPPVAAAAIVVAIAAVTAALTALVSTVSRSERQVDGIASIVTFGLVMLGGNFVFVSQSPPLLRRLALLTPNGWAMRGFTDLQSGLPWTSAIVPVAAILAFAAGVAAIAAARTRWVMLP